MEQRGILSKDPVQNSRYHCIVNIALVTRFCIENGLDERKAYGLSDVYIRQVDLCDSVSKVQQMHKKAVLEFANEMKQIQKTGNLPQKLVVAVDYIMDHLNEKIAIAEVAEYAKVSESQLRRDFQNYYGMSPTNFIHAKKIDEAKNMLVYSEVSYIEIATNLSFASHSHFIKLFKEYTGMTPAAYRNKNYRKHFRE